MTVEEKARAYDKALKWMRELYPGLNGATKEDAEHYFPELRESEDEKIRRVIGLALTDVPEERFTSLGTTLKDCLAYLEKQNHDGKKWITPAKLNRLETLRYEAGYKAGFNVGVHSEAEKQKEQKPAEQLGGTFTSYDMAKTFTEGQNYVIAHPKKFGLCKPAEWSEDTIRRGIREVGLTQHQIDWLKKNVCPQPKQEWSEENEKMLEIVIANYEYMFDKLRKGDDSDGIADHILIMDWLKSLRPQPHWKPSEEQMDALKDVAYGTYQNGDGPALRSLYEQLKKLM